MYPSECVYMREVINNYLLLVTAHTVAVVDASGGLFDETPRDAAPKVRPSSG